jgi:hypothetical protein
MDDDKPRFRAAVFVLAFLGLLLPAFSQDYPTPTDNTDQPAYPGIPPTGGKLEGALGAFTLRGYGTVLLNISASDSGVVGGDVPLWRLPHSLEQHSWITRPNASTTSTT